MRNSKQILALASGLLANEALALNAHRHAHQQLHAKRDLKTELTTVTDWVTVTLYDDEIAPSSAAVFMKGDHSEHFAPAATSASVASSPPVVVPSSSPLPPPPAPPAVTPAETPAPPPATPVAEVVAPSKAPAVPAPASVDVGVTLGAPSGGKRGLAYNNGGLVNLFQGSKATWTYNWGQTPDGAAPSTYEFVPMMWGPTHASGWGDHAEKMIASGAKNFLGFNECDHAAQCAMGPGAAAQAHKQIMNPYSGRVRISTPSITNSGDPNQGIGWLKQFLSACGGACAYDFCAVHWYSPPNADEFLSHMTKAHEACGKPIWITEFAPVGADDAAINTFLATVMHEMDNNPTYSFIERYSYFMVGDGSLVSGNGLSTYGKTFAFA